LFGPPGDTLHVLDNSGRINYRELWLEEGSGYPNGMFLRSKVTGTLEIEFTPFNLQPDLPNRVLSGRKLN